jgi:hypothetical protein
MGTACGLRVEGGGGRLRARACSMASALARARTGSLRMAASASGRPISKLLLLMSVCVRLLSWRKSRARSSSRATCLTMGRDSGSWRSRKLRRHSPSISCTSTTCWPLRSSKISFKRRIFGNGLG